MPFCPQCNAPQIRVASDAERSDASPDTLRISVAPPPPAQSATAIQWNYAIGRTAGAAVATLAAMVLAAAAAHSQALAFFALPFGGMFAVFLYSRARGGFITPGMGARIGAVTGMWVFLISSITSLVQVLMDPNAVFDEMKKTLHAALAANPSPQGEALLQQISNPTGLITLLLLAGILFLFMSLILTSLGGAFAAAMMKGKHE